jgi:hypothetical protein
LPWLLGLQRLAAVAAGLPSRPEARSLSSSKIKSLLGIDGIGGSGMNGLQDPFEGLFTVEIPFYGGPRLTVQGLATHGGRVADFLLTAIFRAVDNALPATFVVKVKALADLLLSISDVACRSAGLDRLSTATDAGRRVNVPSAPKLAQMSRWVQFEEDELFAGLHELAREYLTVGLVREQGAPLPPSAEPSEWSMVQPLVRSGTKLTVAAPADLTAALRHHIVRAAIEENCIEQLVSAMLSLATDKVKELLGGLVDYPFETVSEGKNWVRLQAAFDVDKLMDVFVVVDDLADYDPFSAFGFWDASDVFETIEREATETEGGNRIFRVYSTATIGRDLQIGLVSEDDLTPTIVATLDDLQTILQTPGFDGLGLWYFARAERRLLERTRVLSFSTVDTFSIYRDHNMSFYLGDGPLPSFLSIEVASGQPLRVQNAHSHDHRHFARPDNNGYVEALAAHGRTSSPVYLARVPDGAAYVVDLGETTAWVHIPRRRESDEVIPAQALIVVAEALAYWFWQLWQVEPELVQLAVNDSGVVEFVVRGASLGPDQSSWIQAIDSDDVLQFEISVARAAPMQENQVDRDLVAALYGVLGGESTDTVDRIAPMGPKGMVHVSNPHAMSAWTSENDLAWHGAEEAVSELLDELGLHLTQDLQIAVGPIPDGQRFTVLTTQVVPWLIDRLHDEIAGLEVAGLIERLIDRNEALIASSARESELLAPRIACFGTADDEAQQIQHHLSTASTSMMTSRFLIEFASAFPPSGAKKLNRERYERLLALGSEIINKGMLAETLRSGITDAHLSILESERLGTSQEDDAYIDALEMFSQFRAQAVLADASQPSTQAAATPPDLQRADSLAADAFGFTYTELLEAGRELQDLLNGNQTMTTPRSFLHSALVNSLRWEAEKADAVLDALTLSSYSGTMSSFWADPINVAPWRFNRDRSYLKRPLVQRGDEVSFGRRALVHASVYWIEQYRSGRLRASGKMAAAMNEQRNAKGRAFERQVASLLGEIGYASVKTRFRRVGDYDFRNIEGRNLGDIDVAGIHNVRRELLLLEAKDLEVARTPTELRNEVEQLVGPGNSAIRRLQERADWVASHLGIVLAAFGVTDIIGWSIRTAVVVNQPLLSEHLLNESIPVVALDRLTLHVATPDSRRQAPAKNSPLM